MSARRGLLVGALVVAVAAAALTFLLLRPTTTVSVAGLTVECANTDDESRCAAWAASALEDGPGLHTFDPEDLDRVRLSRSILGILGDCQAEYFLGRYEDVAGRETVSCPDD